jgi:glycosyltransferase involved in cell wall biosynthesis
MRIGLFIETLPRDDGGFVQALSTVECLTHENSTGHEIVVFTPFEQTRRMLLKEGIESIRYKQWGARLVDRWAATVLGGAIFRRLRRLGFKRLGRHLDAALDDHRIDLAIFTDVGEGPLRIGEHPFIVTVWDISHRDYPEFPLAYSDRLFERRERVLLSTLTRSIAVIVDSSCLAERIARIYQVDPHRIVVLPFLPSRMVRRHAAGRGSTTAEGVRQKYDLPPRYVFYPAFPGEEKNHLYLLEGLVALEQHHEIVLHVVFCGGYPPPEWTVIQRQVKALGLDSRARFLGWVPDEDIPSLYQGAVALVYPSYTGPTNLPPVEAVTLGCPVVCSDLPGCREQMGDAALYCDLNDPESLANHLAALVRDPALQSHLQKAGSRLAAEVAKIDYSERLKPLLDKHAYIRRRWTWPENRNSST